MPIRHFIVVDWLTPRQSRPGKVCELCNRPTYTRLAQKLDRAFSFPATFDEGIRDLGNGWWLFCDELDWTFEVNVGYEGTSVAERAASTVRDLVLPTDHATSPWEFRSSLQDFLRQFYSLHQRWGWEYEPLTEEIIRSSALWQESCFLASTLMPTHTHSEATVVAAALRCLVISYDISQITSNWSTRYFQRKDERYLRLADVERNPRGKDLGIQPSICVWRLECDAGLPDSVPQNRETLPQMLQRTFQLAQRLLYRGRPQDWPALFYVFCILLLVSGNIDASLWTEATHRVAMETKKALRELCDIFHHTTGNMQPLSSDLDLERYAALVNENELAVEHYRRMHQMWLDSSEFTRRLKGATAKTSK